MSELEINCDISDEQKQILAYTGKRGLANLSNTCYMNSAIQALLHVFPLSSWFLENRHEKDLDNDKKQKFLVFAWKQLVDSYFNKDSNQRVIEPKTFHNVVNILAEENGLHLYALGKQNDIHEFLQFFIDSIHEALSYPVKVNIKGTLKTHIDRVTMESCKQWAQHYYQQYSPVIGMFYGQLISSITCQNCEHDSRSFTPECCFALPIPSPGARREPVSLIDCWNTFTEPEDLIKDGNNDNRYKCDKCKSLQSARKNISIWKFPKVMIILLKRFRSNGHHSAKIDDMVTYPFNLDLSDYCGSYDKYQAKYELMAVCNHLGGTGGGHYFAFCKDLDNKWRKYNDSSVSEMSEESVVTKSAYCLFYKQV